MAGEWPLVAFTVLGQFAAGLYLFMGIPIYLELGNTGAWLESGSRPGFHLFVLVLLIAASALSLFHLHRPMKAYLTLLNLGRSWLSREILSLLLFGAAAGALTVCEWRGVGGRGVSKALFILGTLAAVLFLLAMSKLYMLPSLPAWNRAHTPLSFFLTAAVLGAVGMTFLIIMGRNPKPHPVIELALCGFAASFANAALLAPVYGVFGVKPGPSLRPPGAGSALLHAARLLLLAGGGIILAAMSMAGEGTGRARERAPVLLAVAFLLIATSEVSGRFLFYGLSGRRT